MAKKTHEQYVKEIEERYSGKVRPIEKYKGYNVAIKHECLVCGRVWEIQPRNTRITKGCPSCGVKRVANKNTLSHDLFMERAKEKMGESFYEYEVLGRYTGNKEPLLVRHKECGYEWEITPSNFYRTKSCPLCHGRVDGKLSEKRWKQSANLKDTEQFKKEVAEVWGDEYTVIGEYFNSGSKVRLRHNECGNECSSIARDFLCGHHACEVCNFSSWGEERVKKYLDGNNYKYKQQYRIDVGEKYLWIDFVVRVGEELVAIEYQGVQHYKPIKFFGGLEALARRQSNDDKKRSWCKDKGWRLIEIPYTVYEETDINNYLGRKL